MSNRVCFIPTKFENLRSGTITLGFRAYDNYDQVYDNTLEYVPDDDLEFLEVITQHSDSVAIHSMFESMRDLEQGCEIDGTWYDWDEVKHIVDA